MRESMQIWFQAIRPFTLSAAVVPVLVGSTLAVESGAFHAFLFILVLVGSVLVQCGTNLTDEYADHDADTAQHKVQAPYKVIARGLLTPAAVLRGALTCFGLATLIGVYLVTQTGWPLASSAWPVSVSPTATAPDPSPWATWPWESPWSSSSWDRSWCSAASTSRPKP